MNATASYWHVNSVTYSHVKNNSVESLNIQKLCSSTKRNLHVSSLVIADTCIILTSQLCQWTLLLPINFSSNCTPPRIRPCLKWNYIKSAWKGEKIHAAIQVTSEIYRKKNTKESALLSSNAMITGTLFLWPKQPTTHNIQLHPLNIPLILNSTH